jgi:hypothetical protein
MGVVGVPVCNLGIFAQTAESVYFRFWDTTSNRARPKQGGTASNVDFRKVISMTAFDPLLTVRPCCRMTALCGFCYNLRLSTKLSPRTPLQSLDLFETTCFHPYTHNLPGSVPAPIIYLWPPRAPLSKFRHNDW